MRVITGSAKGRVLYAPKGLYTRPTADKIKQSIFNIIAADLYGARFLDLFAGSGAIGIEALSRGAKECVFADNGIDAVKAIKKNIANTKMTEKSEVLFMEAEDALKMLSGRKDVFDIIFMDPPYGQAPCIEHLTDVIKEGGLLADDGYIIGECGQDMEFNQTGNAELLKKKNYGKTTAVFFWRPL